MSNRIEKGQQAEEACHGYLSGKGYRLIARNYHCRYGEVDIIAINGEEIVFIEVKSRSRDMEAALSSVSVRKRLKIIRSALQFLQENEQYEAYCIRFDVIGLILSKTSGLYEIRHLVDAFRVEELEELI